MGWLADELSRQLERRRASERSAKQVEKLHEMLTRFLRQHAFSRIHRIRPGEPVLRGPVLGPRFATKKAAPKPPPKLGGAAEAPQPAPRIDIEATYQKKNPVAHVLLRPGMYVGSVRLETAERAWWYDASEARMRQSSLAFNPGIVKIFDEILVNACDNKVRDPAMTRIDVTFDVSPDGELTVTVENDGRGIPVALHHDEGIYVPELVLGHLLTGSNFEDSGGAEGAAASGKGTTGGRHGYGAKLTNIFSTSFSVETVDSAARLRYTQCWRNNMGVTEPPIVSPAPARAKDFTRISFRPDLSRFYTEPASAQVLPEQPSAANGGHRIDAGTLLVMRRRVVDAAGVLADGGVRVSLNGEPVVVSSFLEYASLFNPRALPKPVPPLSNSEGSAAPDETLAQSVALLRRIVGPQPLASVPLGRRWDIAIGVAGLDGISDAAAASDANVANLAGVVASFVNGMATPHGGSHASLVLDILSRRLAPQLHKRVSALLVAAASDASPAPSAASVAAAVTPAVVRAHLRLWVHARVADPSFDSQSKERLVTPMRDLLAQLSSLSTAPGSTSDGDIDAAAATTLGLTDRFLKSLVSDLALAETIAASLRARAELESARTLRRAVKALGPASQVRAIPKLEDANLAGGRRGHECTLILTEGDSAKALAMAGLAVLGRDRFGIFPLRGKLLNVRDVSAATALQSSEIASIVTILGLDVRSSYAGVPAEKRGLRYGRVMIMADQDADGSHIKGLIINLIHTFWPALLEQVPSADGASPEPPFLEQFITPVIKARRGTTLREFFSVRQFEAWREEGRIWAARQQPDSPPSASRATGVGERVFGEAAVGRWTVKYFKGLGTSSAAEGRGYFSALDRHRRPFVWGGAADGDRIDMAFSKDRADERKSWLGAGAADAAVVSSVIPPASDLPELPPDDSEPRASGNSKTADYFSTSTISFGDFVDRELIDFSRADLVRSIPSMLDGLKPSQRKVLFACFKREGAAHRRFAAVAPAYGSTLGGSDMGSDNAADVDAANTSGDSEVVADCADSPPPPPPTTNRPVLPPVGAEVKVAQLAGYVAEHTAYHHGEASLVATIVGMAQDFPGANNVPLLQPLGQFGTRLLGGKDAASARYIFTRLSPIARLLFPVEDDDLLRRRDDDGSPVEPVAYLPVAPLAIFNGALGIGTGWSTSVPPHHPLRVISALRESLAQSKGSLGPFCEASQGEATASPASALDAIATVLTEARLSRAAPPHTLLPWWRGFSGTVEPIFDGNAGRVGALTGVTTAGHAAWEVSKGRSASAGGRKSHAASPPDDAWADNASGLVRITELPVGRWTEDYKAFLQGLVARGAVKSVREYHTDVRAEFLVQLTPQGVADVRSCSSSGALDDTGALLAFFKLASPVSMRNMHLFDARGRIRRYASAEELIEGYIPLRLAGYAARKLRLGSLLGLEVAQVEARQRFLREVVGGQLVLSGRARPDVAAELWARGYPVFGAIPVPAPPPLPVAVAAAEHLFEPGAWAVPPACVSAAASAPAPPPDAPSPLLALPVVRAAAPPAPLSRAFDYLLGLPLGQLTSDAMGRSAAAAAALRARAQAVAATHPVDVWLAELAALERGLDELDGPALGSAASARPSRG